MLAKFLAGLCLEIGDHVAIELRNRLTDELRRFVNNEEKCFEHIVDGAWVPFKAVLSDAIKSDPMFTQFQDVVCRYLLLELIQFRIDKFCKYAKGDSEASIQSALKNELTRFFADCNSFPLMKEKAKTLPEAIKKRLVCERTNADKDWELYKVIKNGGTANELRSLIWQGANVNYKYDKWTMLHYAARYYRHHLIGPLLEEANGANIEARDDKYDATPLMLATWYYIDEYKNEGKGSEAAYETIKILLENGADPNKQFTCGYFKNHNLIHMIVYEADGRDRTHFRDLAKLFYDISESSKRLPELDRSAVVGEYDKKWTGYDLNKFFKRYKSFGEEKEMRDYLGVHEQQGVVFIKAGRQ